MSYALWSSLWHVVLADDHLTLCGRAVPDEADWREIPPPEAFLCAICRGRI
jgi:hypothetical protein